MSRWAPCKREEFIRRLRRLGFDGPFSGTRHQLLRVLLREVALLLGREITIEDWSRL